MKKILLFLALICLGNTVAQTVNEAYHPGSWTRVGKMTKIENNFYFVTPSGGDIPSLYSYDKSGNFRFKKNKKTGNVELMDIIRTMDNKILIVGYNWGCDLVGPKYQSAFIIKTDTNGNNIFDNTISNMGFNRLLKHVVQSTDSSFYAFTDAFMWHYTKNGVLADSLQLPGITASLGAMYLGNNKFMVCSANKLTVMNNNCVVSSQYTSANSYTDPKRISNSSFVAIDQWGRLKRIGLNLQALDSSDLTQGANIKIKSFDVEQDTIYAMGYNTVNQVPVYFKFDTSLVNIFQYNGLTKKIDPRSISVIGGNAAFVSNSAVWTSASNVFAGFTHFDKYTGFVYRDDVGVVDIQIDSMYVTVQSPDLQTYYYFGYYRPKVMIENFGSTVVNSCYVNRDNGPVMYCVGTHDHIKFSNLGLAPGASTTVVWPSFIYSSLLGTGTSPVSRTFTISNISLFTTVPNQKIDGVVENDAFTKSGLVISYVGLDEISADAGMNLYPNPFNDQIHITSQQNKPVKRVELYDVAGKLVLSRDNENVLEMNLNTSALQPGFYLVKLFNQQEQVQVFKVVKQ